MPLLKSTIIQEMAAERNIPVVDVPMAPRPHPSLFAGLPLQKNEGKNNEPA